MNKTVLIACFAIGLIAVAGTVLADSMGPAPNMGDGDSDGSGFESPMGPNGEGVEGDGYGEPAPNMGDGIPDGSGW